MNFQNDIVDHDLQGDNTLFSLNKLKTKKVIFVFYLIVLLLFLCTCLTFTLNEYIAIARAARHVARPGAV